MGGARLHPKFTAYPASMDQHLEVIVAGMPTALQIGVSQLREPPSKPVNFERESYEARSFMYACGKET
jgi:hypothetical protein